MQKRIINFDETIISNSDNRKRGWQLCGQDNKICHSKRLSQINMIAGISNKGDYYYTVNQGKTNSITIMYYLMILGTHLDEIEKDWRLKTILILDNASYHRSKKLKSFFHNLQIPLLYLGPYNFRMAPIELFFSFIKNRDLNPKMCSIFFKQGIQECIKEICLQIDQLDLSWINKCFIHIYTALLQSISLQDL